MRVRRLLRHVRRRVGGAEERAQVRRALVAERPARVLVQGSVRGRC